MEDSGMKKLLLTIMILAFAATAFAQDVTPVPKQKSLEELQWQAMYLQEHIKVLQQDYARSQEALSQVQAELKARQPAQPPKPPEPPAKDEKKPKK